MRRPDLKGPLFFPSGDPWIQWVERWALVALIGGAVVGVFICVGGVDAIIGSGGGVDINIVDLIISFLAH